jgi:gamma-glutamyltranspeptidase/glutathione hydrolase
LERRRYRLKHLPDAPGEARQLLETDYNRRLMTQLRERVLGEGETTHVSVMDGAGNAVSLTQSIERSFGAAVATRDLGFCYNGYLRTFKVQNCRHPYYLRPGLPARSNAAPAVMTRRGRPATVVGSTGSERMVSSIFCTLMRLRSESPFAATQGPRLHCTPEGLVMLEAERFPDSVVAALLSRGHELELLDAYSFRMGGLQLVVADGPDIIGVADARRDGAAICP